MKKIISMLAVLILLLGVLPISPAAPMAQAAAPGTYNPGDIAVINNIIDKNDLDFFSKAPADGSSVPADWIYDDDDGRGVIWTKDSTNKRVTHLLMEYSGVTGSLNVNGLDLLECLDFTHSMVTALDVSNNPKLEVLYCSESELTKLDVSKNTKLKYLNCFENKLTRLDVSKCTSLEWLDCTYNLLPSKDAVIGWKNVKKFYFNPQAIPAKSVKLNASSKTITDGGKTTLKATISPSNANQEVRWKSSKKSVATVDYRGKVTAKAPGKTTITITTVYGGKKATCVITVKPKKTKSVKAKVVSATSAKISWGKVAGVTGYQVRRSTYKNGTYKAVKTTTGTSFTNTKLKAGQTYYYKVRAYKTISGKKVYGKESSIVAVKPKPLKVTGVKATKAASGQAKISWKKQANVSGYQIVRATSKNGTYYNVASTSKLAYTNKKLSAGETYYYKIRAYKTVSGKRVYGAYSNFKSVKV